VARYMANLAARRNICLLDAFLPFRQRGAVLDDSV
jgi:hypothetical protein